MNVKDFLSRVEGRRLIVLGDLMIDRYLWGKTDRISPEAPVPVVEVYQEENRLGGAANVALNLHTLGAKVSLGGMIGEDAMGELLHDLAEEYGFGDQMLLRDPARPTTVKTRIIAQHQQLLRVDKEVRTPLSEALQQSFLQHFSQQLLQADAIILQDYDKGFFNPKLLAEIISLASAEEVPVLADPKFDHFSDFAGCTLFKPNLRELRQGMKMTFQGNSVEEIRKAADLLRANMPHTYSLITMGANGMLLLGENLSRHFPAKERQIADVSGAGDTVIALLGLGLAAGIGIEDTVHLANLAGGLVCEEVGVVPIRPERLLEAS